ncbi:MAG: polysaccharide biosynthesis C-terminal domain-containing protein [Terriglobales bacterium]|jgi:O-antigen/teichoic acid export membrane protein
MKLVRRGLFQNILHLGSGELVGRLCGVAIAVWLGRRCGVVVLGVYALAQSLTQYLQPLIDFGLRHVGARLLAMHPESGRTIVHQVQRRRLRMAAAVLPLLWLYSISAQLPGEMKIVLFSFSAVGALYALSLDWAAWGQGRLYLVGLARSVVPASILAFVLVGRAPGNRVLWWAAAGNAAGFLLQGAIFWSWWRRQPMPPVTAAALVVIRESLAWRRTSIMGLAWLCNLAFNTIDLLMLGLLSNPEQVGLYGAAYRILNQVLITYYLLTQVLYPRFARHRVEERARMLGVRILLLLALAGMVLAWLLSVSRQAVISVVFGHRFLAACPLLLLLAWSIPFDFLTSYLSNAFLAWGMEKKVLRCTGIAAASNIVLNLVLIPVYGARGAAINTLLSYAIFLAALGRAGWTARELFPPPALAAMDAIAGAPPCTG